MIIDGLQINNWSRPVIDEVRSGGVDIVHATVGVWEDLAATMTRIGAFRHLCRHNADAIRIVRSAEEMHQAKADGVLGIVLGFQNSSMLGDDPEMAGIFADVGVRVEHEHVEVVERVCVAHSVNHLRAGPHRGGAV